MIRVSDLSCDFGKTQVLAGLNLVLDRDETLVVSGPSGIGKTTLLRLIAGLEGEYAGEIEVDGIVMTGGGFQLSPHRRRIGMVFQRPALWPHMDVAAHLDFVSSGSRKQRCELVANLMQESGLTHLASRRPHQLSLGQARRVALARALAACPRYLLMDEPLTNLDQTAKDELIRLIKFQAAALRAGLLFVTHDEWEAVSLGGVRLWLREGSLWRDSDAAVPFP